MDRMIGEHIIYLTCVKLLLKKVKILPVYLYQNSFRMSKQHAYVSDFVLMT